MQAGNRLVCRDGILVILTADGQILSLPQDRNGAVLLGGTEDAQRRVLRPRSQRQDK